MDVQLKELLGRLEREAQAAPPKSEEKEETGQLQLTILEISALTCALEVALAEASDALGGEHRLPAMYFITVATKLHKKFSGILKEVIG